MLAAAEIVDKGDMAVVEKIFEFQDGIDEQNDKIDSSINEIKNNFSSLKEELLANVDEEFTGIKEQIDAISKQEGPAGKDYIITEKDKADIASKITVPVVEKVIERVVHEQPTIKNTTTETRIENPETGMGIIEKINELGTDPEFQIDQSHVKDLLEDIEKLKKTIAHIVGTGVGGVSGIKGITAGTNITIDNSNPQYPVVTSSGGGPGGSGFQLPLTGAVNGVNKVFTWTTAPSALLVDDTTIQKSNNGTSPVDTTANWTGTTTTTLLVAPNFSICALA